MRRPGLLWITMMLACGDDEGDDDSMGGTLGSSDGVSSADDDGNDGSASGGLASSTSAESDGGSDSDTGTGASFECTPGLMCQQDTEYCLVTIGGPVGSRPGYECEPIPRACADMQTCDCLASAPCGNTCQMVAGGGIEVTCAAP